MTATATTLSAPLVLVSGVTKSFPGVMALRRAELEVRAGEVHALVGENGAGKSTLMKILAGVYLPDAGEVRLSGQPARFATPRAAQDAGIVTIFQEFNLVPAMTVAENIFLGAEPQGALGLLDWAAMNRRAAELLARVGVRIDPRRPVSELGVGQQQMVEIAKALAHDARLVIMDEPTAALSLTETRELFRVVGELRARGVAVLFISHHLEEVFEIADRVTVMRDGAFVQTLDVRETDVLHLIRLMVGRDLGEQFPKEAHGAPREVLRVEGLTRRDGTVRDAGFSLRAGEVLGVGGLMGAGRTELLRALFGADPISGGRVWLEGREVRLRSPSDAAEAGLAFLTEDRKAQGLVPEMTVRENVTLGVLGRLLRGPFLNRRGEADLTRRFVRDLGIRTPSPEQPVVSLSGGNQQKVLLSRALARQPRVLLLDEPTRGVDVGAKVEIYRLVNRLAREGLGIVMVSSDLPELLGMSDRVLVMHGGRVAGELARPDFSQEAVMRLAAGLGARAAPPEGPFQGGQA